MRPTRGDIIIVATGSGFGGKPRPALVIQADAYSELSTVVVALFTSELTSARLRLRVEPSATNGLRDPSDLMIDALITVRREKIGGIAGRLEAEHFTIAQRSLLGFLGFA